MLKIRKKKVLNVSLILLSFFTTHTFGTRLICYHDDISEQTSGTNVKIALSVGCFKRIMSSFYTYYHLGINYLSKGQDLNTANHY